MNKFSALYEDLWEKSPREIADHFERDTKGDALSNAKKYKAELSKRKNRTDPRRVDAAIYMLAKETDRRPREQSFESRMRQVESLLREVKSDSPKVWDGGRVKEYRSVYESAAAGDTSPLAGRVGDKFYTETLGNGEEVYKEIKQLLTWHGHGGGAQKEADARIKELLTEKSAAGKMMRDVTAAETALLRAFYEGHVGRCQREIDTLKKDRAWAESVGADEYELMNYDNDIEYAERRKTTRKPRLYRKGEIGKGKVESWTQNSNGAQTQHLGDTSMSIVPDKSADIGEMLDSGYLCVGGIGRMTGASGESEVTMIKLETKKKSFRELAKDTSLKVKTKSDLEKIADASLPKDDSKYEYFYHATRNRSDVDSILSKGILPGRGNSRVWLSKDEIRDLGGGIFVVRVPKGKAEAGTDRVETGLKYREWTVSEVPSGDIVRVMREIPRSGTDHTIREDKLAKYLLKNTSDRDDPSDLPEEYRKWFDIKISRVKNGFKESLNESRLIGRKSPKEIAEHFIKAGKNREEAVRLAEQYRKDLQKYRPNEPTDNIDAAIRSLGSIVTPNKIESSSQGSLHKNLTSNLEITGQTNRASKIIGISDEDIAERMKMASSIDNSVPSIRASFVRRALRDRMNKVIVIKNNTKIISALSFSEFKTGYSIEYLGSLEKGGGISAVIAVAKEAASKNKSLLVDSADEESHGFYRKIGMKLKEGTKNIYKFTPEEVKSFISKNQDGIKKSFKEIVNSDNKQNDVTAALIDGAKKLGHDITTKQANKMYEAVHRFIGRDYKNIRLAQQGERVGTASETEELVQVADDVEKVIEISPKFEGDIYRGLRFTPEEYAAFKNRASVGSIIDMRGISSWSSDLNSAREFSNISGSLVIAKVTNKTGISVQHFGNPIFGGEKEIIVSSRARFKVISKSVHRPEGGRQEITFELEEIDKK